MTKVAITGADGFTGIYLAKLLKKLGYEVHGLIRSSQKIYNSQIEFHNCDLSDRQSLIEALGKIQPQKIVHLAAISFVSHGDIGEIYQTNIIGTRKLVEASLNAKLPIQSILIASSASIYGNQTGGIIAEDSAPAPANDYAVSKIAMEYVAKIYSNRLPIITVRPFNYTGIGQRESFLIPKIIDHIRRRADYIELGNLDVARDFSDVRAVVAAYAGLLNEKAAIGKTYNICSGRAYSLRQVLDIASKFANHLMEIRINPAFVRHNEVKTLLGTRQRLDTLITNLPNPPLEDTLRWMMEA